MYRSFEKGFGGWESVRVVLSAAINVSDGIRGSNFRTTRCTNFSLARQCCRLGCVCMLSTAARCLYVIFRISRDFVALFFSGQVWISKPCEVIER